MMMMISESCLLIIVLITGLDLLEFCLFGIEGRLVFYSLTGFLGLLVCFLEGSLLVTGRLLFACLKVLAG